MTRFCVAFFFFNLISITVFGQSSDPDSAKIVTDDINRFWSAFDQAAPAFEPNVFEELYINQGTIGLKDFVKSRIESADKLAKVIRKHPKYTLKYLYAEAVFPDVYFLIGRMNTGGTTSNTGLLIGVEMYGKTPEMPFVELSDWHKQVLQPIELVPHIVAHELIHYQQKYRDAIATLLSASLQEGIADFIAELISGRHINHHVHQYANPREEEFWNEFIEKMESKDYSSWLYNGNEAGGRPADLGYWIGYKIAESYYKAAKNRRQAIKDMLEIDDFKAFLEKTGMLISLANDDCYHYGAYHCMDLMLKSRNEERLPFTMA